MANPPTSESDNLFIPESLLWSGTVDGCKSERSLPCHYMAAGRAQMSTRGELPACRLCNASPAWSSLWRYPRIKNITNNSDLKPITLIPIHNGMGNYYYHLCFVYRNRYECSTLNHVFACLAAGRPTEDMLLETVGLDLLGWLSLSQGLWGHRQRGA